MRKPALPIALGVLLLSSPANGAPSEGSLHAKRWTLGNGIRVVLVHVPGSENVSIFTYLPMGLAGDGPGQGQWVHLLEHLIIRSTIPAGSQQANAETLADHMRLDFYGTVDNWQEGVSHHARWLSGTAFTQEALQREKPLVQAECDVTAKRLATHKFALAAWAQGFRHGRVHAALKGDVASATLAQIQQHRDKHLTVLDKTVVCVVGGLSDESVRPVLQRHLGAITSNSRQPQAVQPISGNHDMTWDLDARHLMLSWPIPGPNHRDFAPLLVAQQLLLVRCFTDAELKGMTGMVLADSDLTVPEGRFFYLSASLKPGVSFDAVRRRIDGHLRALRQGEAGGLQIPMMARQQAMLLTTLPDLSTLKRQAPQNVPAAMIEGNLGLRWGMQELRYGSHRLTLARALRAVGAKDVRRTAQTHLVADKASTFAISPR